MDVSRMKQTARSEIDEFLFTDFLSIKGDVNESCPIEFVFVYENDSKTDATFLIHSLLNSYLKSDLNVCFLALNQTFSHYNAVSAKLGVDLKAVKDSGRLSFIEGLKLVGESIINNCENTEASDTKTDLDDIIVNNSLGDLFNTLCCQLDKLTSSEKSTVIIIDNISIFLSIGIQVKDIIRFCHRIMLYLRVKNIGPLITMSNCFGDDEECESMVKFLRHLCSISIKISSLLSGYCKDVHGEMKVVKRRSLSKRKTLEKSVQFKISDKTISLFALGLSSAVL